ncbi:hypothetical protein [Streptosporangium jomthongense]|uniref:Uncharacterized protein n=1 Tax=Streptosporangium jomthongense TaxID=1193683 RepID=A0ABV8EV93_9ACTN
MIPAWLLARSGGQLRTAGITQCPRCFAPVLRGLDAEKCALPVRADIGPIDEMGEAIALLQGRATYDLVGNAQKKELEHRYEWHIRNPRRYPVLAAHKCGSPLPAIPARAPEILTEAESNDAPF